MLPDEPIELGICAFACEKGRAPNELKPGRLLPGVAVGSFSSCSNCIHSSNEKRFLPISDPDTSTACQVRTLAHQRHSSPAFHHHPTRHCSRPMTRRACRSSLTVSTPHSACCCHRTIRSLRQRVAHPSRVRQAPSISATSTILFEFNDDRANMKPAARCWRLGIGRWHARLSGAHAYLSLIALNLLLQSLNVLALLHDLFHLLLIRHRYALQLLQIELGLHRVRGRKWRICEGGSAPGRTVVRA